MKQKKIIKYSKLKEMVRDYRELEMLIIDATEKLPNAGNDCNCGIYNREGFTYIFEGKWSEIQTKCLKCGGYITGEC